jgi:hypothetical protein
MTASQALDVVQQAQAAPSQQLLQPLAVLPSRPLLQPHLRKQENNHAATSTQEVS